MDFGFLFGGFLLAELVRQGMEQLHIVLVHDDAGVLFVDRFIVKAALDGSIHRQTLDLPHHFGDAVCSHLGAVHCNHRAEVQKLAQCRPVLLLVGPAPLGNAVDLRNHVQGTVRGKVKDVAAFLLFAVQHPCRLHPEDGLHIAGRSRACRPGQHHHSRPLRHRHAGGQLAAGNGNGVAVRLDDLLYQCQGVVVGHFGIAVTCNVSNFIRTKHRVVFQQPAQGTGFFHARNHPEGMPEHLPVLRRGVGVVALRVLRTNQVQKAAHIGLVDKITHLCASRQRTEIPCWVARPHPEKLGKVERHLQGLVAVGGRQTFPKVEGQDAKFRQVRIGVMVAGVQGVPLPLALLLHDVVPCVDVVLVLLHQVVRCAGQLQNLGSLAVLFRFQQRLHLLPSLGLGALVGFIVNHKIPVHIENGVILVKLAVCPLRAAQVLHGGKVNKRLAGILVGCQVCIVACIHCRIVNGRIRIETVFLQEGTVISFAKNQVKIVAPAILHHRAVGDHNHLLIARFFDERIGRDRFAETHLAVPEHRVFLAEHPQRLIDAVHLLIPQGNGSLFGRSRDSLRQKADLPLTLFGSGQSRAALFYRLNRTNGNGQRHLKPFAVLIGIGELPGRKARIVQHVMDIVIIKQFRIGRTIREGDGSACQLGILQVVFNHRRLGILVDAVTGSTIQLRTVGRKLFVAVHAVKICLSDLPVALVLGIVNRKDVNQPIRHGWLIRCHLLFLLSPLKEKSSSDWNANPL